jgi:hypothetical protein
MGDEVSSLDVLVADAALLGILLAKGLVGGDLGELEVLLAGLAPVLGVVDLASEGRLAVLEGSGPAVGAPGHLFVFGCDSDDLEHALETVELVALAGAALDRVFCEFIADRAVQILVLLHL